MRAIDTGDDLAGVRLEAADGRNIITSFNTLTAAATGVKAGGQTGSFNLVSNNGNPIEISSTSAGRVSRSGLQVGTYERGISAVTTDARAIATNAASAFTLNSGDLKINDIAIRGASADDDTFSDASALVVAKGRVGDRHRRGDQCVVGRNQCHGQGQCADASTVRRRQR